MDDMDNDDVQVHVSDEPMDISDDDLDGASKPSAGFKKLGKRRKKTKAAEAEASPSEEAPAPSAAPEEEAAQTAVADEAVTAVTADTDADVTAVTSNDASEKPADSAVENAEDIIPEPEASFTAVDAQDLEGTKVRRLGRKKRSTPSTTFQLPTSEVSQGLLYGSPVNDHAKKGPKEASETKHFGQEEIDNVVAMLGDSLKDPAAEAEAMIDGNAKASDAAEPDFSSLDSEDAEMMTRLSQDLDDIGSPELPAEEVDVQEDVSAPALPAEPQGELTAPDIPELSSEEQDALMTGDEVDPGETAVTQETTMESETAVSQESLQRARMLAAKVKTGAPTQKGARTDSRFGKFFSRDSRGYASMTPARKSMPMVSVARRMGIAAITAIVVTTGFVAGAQFGADASGKDTASLDRLKTQLQELADASLTDAERQVACTQVETETVAAVMEPSAAPHVSARPPVRTAPQAQEAASTDTSADEVRPPLP